MTSKDKAVIAVLAAMKEEQQAILEAFNGHKITPVKEFNLELNIIELEKAQVIVALSGCGKVNAGSTTTIIIMKYHPDYILNVGVAGGFDEAQKPLDMVVGTSYLYTDVDIECLGFKPGQLLGMPVEFPASEKLVETVKKALPKDTKIFCGIMGSADQFISRPDQVAAIRSKFTVSCVDMEACAIAHVCYNFKVPMVSVRSLSDVAVHEHDNSVTFLECVNIASKRAADLCLAVVHDLTE